MKKILIIALILFATVEMITITGCSNTPVVPPSIASRLVGKWTMKTAIGNYTINGVNSPQTTTFTASDYFEFKADGTVTIVQNGTTTNGNWKVTNDRVFFTATTSMDNTPGWAVPVLTANTLQFYNKEVTTSSTSEFTLNLTK